MDIEVFEKGILIDIKVKEGEEVLFGIVICYIGDVNELVQEEVNEQVVEESELLVVQFVK